MDCWYRKSKNFLFFFIFKGLFFFQKTTTLVILKLEFFLDLKILEHKGRIDSIICKNGIQSIDMRSFQIFQLIIWLKNWHIQKLRVHLEQSCKATQKCFRLFSGCNFKEILSLLLIKIMIFWVN